MRSYECAVIFVPDSSEETLKSQSSRYVQLIADGGGEMTRLETWGKRRMAYEIEHHSEGFYYFFKFRGKDEVLTELQRQMRIDEGILRHMIIRDERAKGDAPAVAPGEIEAVAASEPKEA